MSSLYEFDTSRMDGSGLWERGQAGEALGDRTVVYYGADGLWWLADASAVATMPVIGITMGAIGSGKYGKILLHGIIGFASWTWIRGTIMYASTTAGVMTQVPPGGPGDQLQQIGVAKSAVIIYFHPGFRGLQVAGMGGALGDYTYLIERVGATYNVYDNRGNIVSSSADADTEINWAFTTGGVGTVVYLREDTTFAINDPITFTANNQVLRGGGRSSFIDGDGLATGEHGIVLSGFDDCVISDLSIQTQDGGTKTCHCIFIEDGADRFLIESVVFVDSDHSNIWIEGTTINDGHIHNCELLGADNDCIYVDIDDGNYLNRLKITDCEITSGGARGIMFAQTTGAYPNTLIQGNTIHDNGYEGILAYDFEGSIIEENHVFMNGWSGIYLNTVTGGASVLDNQCYLNGRHGIFFTEVDKSIIEGNVCSENDSGDTANYDGIFVGTGSDDNVVANNYCELNHRYGIYSIGLRVEITGNSAIENDRHGIFVNNVQSLIEGNYVYDNGQDTAGTYHGIYMGTTSDRSSIIGNRCDSPGDSQEDGIYVLSTAHEILISGNYCYNGMGSGITLVDDNDDCHIQGNYCSANDDYGIEIITANADRTFCQDNRLLGNITGCILDNGTDTAIHHFWEKPPNIDSNIGDHPAMQMLDEVDTYIYDQTYIPLEYQELVTAQIVVAQGTAVAPNMVWTVDTDWGKICVGEDYFEDSDVTGDTTTMPQDDLVCLDFSAALDGIAPGDLVGVSFMRDGDNILDTVGGPVFYLGIRIRYV